MDFRINGYASEKRWQKTRDVEAHFGGDARGVERERGVVGVECGYALKRIFERDVVFLAVEPKRVFVRHGGGGDVAHYGAGQQLKVVAADENEAICYVAWSCVAHYGERDVLVGVAPNAFERLHVGFLEDGAQAVLINARKHYRLRRQLGLGGYGDNGECNKENDAAWHCGGELQCENDARRSAQI